jgi:hypothetical protein
MNFKVESVILMHRSSVVKFATGSETSKGGVEAKDYVKQFNLAPTKLRCALSVTMFGD